MERHGKSIGRQGHLAQHMKTYKKTFLEQTDSALQSTTFYLALHVHFT